MLRKSLFIIIALFVTAVFAQDSLDVKESKIPCCGKKAAIEKSENLQSVCPVMGGEIHKEFFTDHEGNRIYFCCSACIETFKKDPETYLKKLEEAGVTLYKTPCCENQDRKGCKKDNKTTNP